MKLIIEISDQYVPILSRWASISRTLDNAQLMADTVHDTTTDMRLKDRAKMCMDELYDIRPAVDHMHKQVQNAIWAMKRGEDDHC